MSKDPAFLFYSQAFFESTRMMFPEERACYIDLLVYQHQNGIIPLDTSRLTLYCVGVSNEVVNKVLNQKFTKTEHGWLNEKMMKVVDDRKKGSPKKIAYATLAGLLSSNQLSNEASIFIKSEFNVNDYLELSKEEIKSTIKEWFYDLVNIFVNNNKDKTKDKDKDKTTIQKKYRKTDFKNALLELGAIEQHIDDWFVVRTQKKGAFTKTAFTKFFNECKKNNFPIADAVKICAERSWVGFEYKWLKNIKTDEPTINRQTAETYHNNGRGW